MSKFSYDGVTVTVVALKGDKQKKEDMLYKDALKAREEFIKENWYVKFYQIGFYTD